MTTSDNIYIEVAVQRPPQDQRPQEGNEDTFSFDPAIAVAFVCAIALLFLATRHRSNAADKPIYVPEVSDSDTSGTKNASKRT